MQGGIASGTALGFLRSAGYRQRSYDFFSTSRTGVSGVRPRGGAQMFPYQSSPLPGDGAAGVVVPGRNPAAER